MATCPKCGTANAPGSTFCISCGTDLPDDATQQPPQPQGQPAAAQPAGWAAPPPPGWNPPAYQQYPQQGYQQQQYQAAGYGPPPQRIYNYMPLAIVALIVGIFGCAVLAVPGIVSLVFASQVDGKANMGDYHGAMRSARTAKIWGIVGLSIMAALVAALGILAIIGALSTSNGSGGSGSF